MILAGREEDDRRWRHHVSTPKSSGEAGCSAGSGVRSAIAQIAADLGIHREALCTWVCQARADAGSVTSAECEELKRLRKENNELKRANETLKAASTVFGAELGQPRTR